MQNQQPEFSDAQALEARRGCSDWAKGCLSAAFGWLAIPGVFMIGLITSIVMSVTQDDGTAFLKWMGGTIVVCAVLTVVVFLFSKRKFKQGTQHFKKIDEL